MQRLPKLSSESGFTLVEIMISSGLLALALAGAASQYISQVQAKQGINLQIQTRLKLNTILSELHAQKGQYPYIQTPSGGAITWVSCFDEKGGVLPNRFNNTNYYMANITDANQARPWEIGVGSNQYFCSPGFGQKGGLEVHIRPVVPGVPGAVIVPPGFRRDVQQVLVTVIVLRNVQGGINLRGYNPATESASQLVTF